MVSRKRARQEPMAEEPPEDTSLLRRVRNMWEFANLAQWISLFGKAVKLKDDLDVELIESECMDPSSTLLSEIGLALLKFVSSHRGLTPEIFDEYTRRQFLAKAPHCNPFGENETPAKFNDFDVFTKIKVLQQLTQWTMGNSERIREKTLEQKDTEQTRWRTETFGIDSENRTYIVLADNRLYRQTNLQQDLAMKKPKKVPRKSKSIRRCSRRTKELRSNNIGDEIWEGAQVEVPGLIEAKHEGLGFMKWECIAVSYDDYLAFLSSIERSRDPNEKLLRKKIIEDVLPQLEKLEQSRRRKQAQKEREMLAIEKVACAKRSSRIAGRVAQQKIDEAQNMERKRIAELELAKKNQNKWNQLESEDSRTLTREQRHKEREARRITQEVEIFHQSDIAEKYEDGEIELAEPFIKKETGRNKIEPRKVKKDDDWTLDCICGEFGQSDDGTHSVVCDKCNTWQHSSCVNITKEEADMDDFSFICSTCKRRDEDIERAKNQPSIKIKLKCPSLYSSPLTTKRNLSLPTTSDIYYSGESNHPLRKSSLKGISLDIHRYSNEQCLEDLQLKRNNSSATCKDICSQNRDLETSNHQNLPAAMELTKIVSDPISSHLDSQNNSEDASYPNLPVSEALQQQSQYHDLTPLSHSSRINPNKNESRCPSITGILYPDDKSILKSNHNFATSPTKFFKLSGSDNPNPNLEHTSDLYHTSCETQSNINDGKNFISSKQQSPIAVIPNLTLTSNSISTLASPNNQNLNTTNTYGSPSLIPPHSPLRLSLNTEDHEFDHTSALPPAATGISPVKTSPLRINDTDISFSSPAPTILPPVATLIPSPQVGLHLSTSKVL
ncbi:PHD finger domain-containing protein [Blumeria hordei DH14]|uniref:PHD finger domain-containing protein n=1 Tax=Blumeria graminis f. sp. hordei (strain DH14) TaxID=546991 RepID=N1JBD8_BLUG1|nr:PHD finger domain-containing protein [Blumeria hordei DH14]